MELIIVYILVVYFSMGAVAVWFINRKKDRVSAKNGWLKYVVYLAIVCLILFSINWKGLYLAVVSGIMLVSLYEIIHVWRNSRDQHIQTLLAGLVLFSIASVCFLFHVVAGSQSFQLVLYTIVFSFDGFSQISGQLFGKRQLVPGISPGKTFGGLTGGLIAALFTGQVLFPYISLKTDHFFDFVITLIIAVSAFSGDLLASVYKRRTGVKDYSNLIPGHGGMLDRFDSFIFAGAVAGILKLVNCLS